MFDLGMAKFHVNDLNPEWQNVAKNIDPELVIVWVVFYKGRVFGVYSSVMAAAKAIARIELQLVAGKKPQPQSAIRVLLERKKKDAQLKDQDSSGSKPVI